MARRVHAAQRGNLPPRTEGGVESRQMGWERARGRRRRRMEKVVVMKRIVEFVVKI